MRPFDPRLVRHARATAPFLAASVAAGLATAGLVIVQAVVLADVLHRVFLDGADLSAVRTPLLVLAGVVAGRSVLAWAQEVLAHRTSAAVRSQLRQALLAHVVRLGPAWLSGQRAGELATLVTRGTDALDTYFARYLPQLVLAAVVPPAVVAWILGRDWPSALVVAVTLPLVPVFMVLIGLYTRHAVDRQWQVLSRLAGHFLDVVAGLPTLKVFGRARAQAAVIGRVTGEYRRATLATLRVAFLSALVLEVLSTLSVALVAVSVGLRLVDGGLDLRTALVVLILAPEAYLPLRQVGAQFHASAEGLAAAGRVFDVLETLPPVAGRRQDVPSPATVPIHVDAVTVRYPGRSTPALERLSLTVPPGAVTVLVGPSGCGKSTLLALLLGFVRPDEGRIRVGAVDLGELDPRAWRQQVAWVPQRPYLVAGSVADNVRLGRPGASTETVERALRAAGLPPAELPRGIDTAVGQGGAGLSAGQRQRVALARALLRNAPLVLLDEPTAHLDADTEAVVLDTVRRLAHDQGRTVVVVAHRPAMASVADTVVRWAGDRAAAAVGGSGRQGAGAGGDAATGVEAAACRAAGPPAPAAVRAVGPRQMAWLARPVCGRLAVAVLAGAAALGCAVGLAATAAWLVFRAAQHPPVLYLMVAVVAVRAFGLGRGVFRYLERLVAHDAALRLLAALRVRVYRHLERLAPAGLPAFRSGDLLGRLVSDVDDVQDLLLRVVVPGAVGLVVGIGSVLLLWALLPAAGVVLLVMLLVAGIVAPWVTARVTRAAGRRLSDLRRDLSARVVDVLYGLPELLAHDADAAALADLAGLDRELTRAAACSARSVGLGAGLATAACGLAVFGEVLVGVPAVRAGSLHGLLLGVLVLVPFAVFEIVAGLSAAAQQLPRVRRSTARVLDVMRAPAPVTEPDCPRPLPPPPYRITVRGLRAGWPNAARPALDGVDLDLSPGRRVAVVGPSGAGKSTLVAVLLRFLDPLDGSVFLNGVPLTELAGDDVRRVVGLCAQDAHVFDSTVAENVRLARPGATDAQVREVLQQAGLGGWLASLPRGLDTPVGEHGGQLSGGQRQRIALARALLAGFPVLVADEPTANLDVPTADALTAELLDCGGTVLLVTHRLAGLQGVDEIVVLVDGRVVQRGTHAQLVAQPGPYQRMWRRERGYDALLADPVDAGRR